MPTRPTIKELPADDRPREKMRRLGAQALSDAELLAVLLGAGTPGETAVELARRLLAPPDGRPRADGGGGVVREDAAPWYHLAQATLEDLSRARGVGLAKAARIKAAVEVGRRLATSSAARPAIRCAADLAALLMEDMRHLDREHFRIVLLNTKHQVLGVQTISVGDLASSIVHPREVFKEAIRRSAAAIVLAHNHPSGDPTPSREDAEVTRRLREAGRLVGIEVLDHVVIGDNRYVSFREQGIG